MQKFWKIVLTSCVIAASLSACKMNSFVSSIVSSSTKTPEPCTNYITIDHQELEFRAKDHVGECVQVNGEIIYIEENEVLQIYMGSDSHRPLAALMDDPISGFFPGDVVVIAGRVAGNDHFEFEPGIITLQPYLENAIILCNEQ